ncbi:hypothetical protein [Bifidobacterium mongoliense]|uniref:hypothetical protein n=1 Tax=Bifidobacterium mongoliense TaxID=518643 RepID=UPI0030EE2DEB
MIDAHAFLYFGDGQSVKFHSGRYKPDGGALMIGKEGIEGWWSAPDLKVDVKERASGNGAHDVSSDSILYATRTVTVHFDAIGDVHSEVLDAVTKVSQANGLPVRLRVVDDRSDTFVSGFIRPQFGSAWNERHQTGTLTIVCPRPERLAWSPLQSQLFPVSVMQGGLRYSTVHRLVSAWIGTPNASTSALSHDGTVVATNLFPTPRWASADMGNTSITQTADGFTITTNKTYTGSGDDHNFYPENVVAGTYHFHAETDDVLTTTLPDFSMWIGGWVPGGSIAVPNTRLSSPSVIDIDLTTTGRIDRITFKCGMTAGDHATWRRIGLYTAADWNAMQALGVDWFSGDSYPVPTGKGLSYPLNYGTGGVASNVALLINQGSSKAFPVFTVTGPFTNGVQIQWGGNALQYDGTIGAVPLILDSRSQTASMGGVDVSRNLSRRDFPMVPAGGSVSLRLMSAGTGWVTAVCRDTYI